MSTPRDPQARPHVLTQGSWPSMRWDRWADRRAGDPRWSVPVIDTTHSSPAVVAERVARWMDERGTGTDATLGR